MPGLFEPKHDAELLRKATSSSWSTDHNLLIHVLAENERTNEQMQELRHAFLQEYKECPIKTVMRATNLPHQSAYSWALVATLLTREEFAAECLHWAMALLGTDERAMIQILAHSTKEEVERIKGTYLRMYSKTLERDIIDDTSGNERDFFMGLINAPRSHVDVAAAQDEIDRDVKELYLAGQARWSSDTSTFVNIIMKHDNEYLAALNLAYGRAYGDTLQRAVEEEISHSVLAKGMAAMIMDRADYYASELNWAISGAGTNTDTLTRIIATQRHTMPAICHRYMIKFGKNLRQHLEQENAVNGTQYGKVLLSLLKVAEASGEGVPPGSSTPAAPRTAPPPPVPEFVGARAGNHEVVGTPRGTQQDQYFCKNGSMPITEYRVLVERDGIRSEPGELTITVMSNIDMYEAPHVWFYTCDAKPLTGIAVLQANSGGGWKDVQSKHLSDAKDILFNDAPHC
ncbi:hypothetical protein DUNSADRAFT_13212 [Dunaliella salina]|uniref:Annexin n=1 Tax=Dunaliella salina TaxID=3046 RepID=A0ABQ7G9W1_DUNSA|nr:hypothetical protein DUNSADRAFT_13212 [Dunaliella salina]|eukprot:KAF5831370.1 hypothetical protein DUNSADRAFT_13212 [Dunaliella salina]